MARPKGYKESPLMDLSDQEIYLTEKPFGSRENRLPEHLANQKREVARRTDYSTRQFIFWDGEGVGGHDDQSAQRYVLFGCSDGPSVTGENLSTRECLDLLVDTAAEHPKAFHVAFAFDYDVNMILADLSPHHFRVLKEKGSVVWHEYRIEHVPHKWFTVTRKSPGRMPWDDPVRQTVKVMDVFGFFQCSFVKALKSYIPDHPLMTELGKIEAGKAARQSFEYDQIEMITSYWWTEAQLGAALVSELRDLMFGAGFKINSWHGPGALANYVYRKHGIAEHKQECPEPVQDAAQYGYAGGRFELFRMGRHLGPVYSLDINSAYPWAISQLPSLSEGFWRHKEGFIPHWDTPAEFGIYYVTMRHMDIKNPQPLFHRSIQGNITFPSWVSGWYWTPEVEMLIKHLEPGQYQIHEGWEYLGWKTRPFEYFVNDYYNTRKRMKADGIGSEKAIKLALNSLYGKMAQRVGWERTGTAPKWHQLEWAGWVTSKTRATLYDVLRRIPWQHQIAVETDGLYTTYSPELLGIEDSKNLGGWEVKEYGEILYLQSGVYAIGKSSEMYSNAANWNTKYRGLNPGSLNAAGMAEYLRTTEGKEWEHITGPDTRFNGYQISLARSRVNEGKFYENHRRWVTIEKRIAVGSAGKRVHRGCPACASGQSAYDAPHDLQIASSAFKDSHSARHHIPWRDNDPEPIWREFQDGNGALLKA